MIHLALAVPIMPKSDEFFDPSTYATVAERLTKFYGKFPGGRVITELVSRERGVIIFRAQVFRSADDALPSSTGWASEREDDGEINAVACLENTETSAIGRALANLGFTASLKRPSREEMEKAERARRRLSRPHPTPGREVGTIGGAPSAELQRKANAVQDLQDLLGVAHERGFSALRARIITTRANATTSLPFSRLRGIEAAVRAWMRRHAPVV